MFIIYDLIFLVFVIFSLPKYIFKEKFHQDFLLRLGILPKNLELGRPIWIHAVSVGEVIAVKEFIEELRKAYPQKKLVISTVTASGNKIAKSIARQGDFVTYLPLDFSFIVRKVLNTIKPSLVIIAETEIWPNFISYLYNKVPIVVINARISDKSFKGYRMVKFLIKYILNKIDMFCAQTETDATRLVSLGFSRARIRVTGNMKFDIKGYIDYNDESVELKNKIGISEDYKLFVAGSTHPKEEEIIVGVYKNLLKEFPYLRLLLVPRHPERSEEIEVEVLRQGFLPVKITRLDLSGKRPWEQKEILILNTVGQLLSFYRIADIVFVGGSLIKKGGHNILEPASLTKPVIFGPYMFNFREITDLFLNSNAGIQIHNQQELENAVRNLLINPLKMEELVRNAQEVILKNKGATLKNLEYIETIIKNYAKLSV